MRRIICLYLFSLFIAIQAHSALLVVPGFPFANIDGTYTYQYVIENLTPGESVSGFSLEFDFDSSEADFSFQAVPLGGDVTVHSDWFVFEGPVSGDGGTGLDLISFNPSSFVQTNEQSSIFGFTTEMEPGTITYKLYNSSGGVLKVGTILGPTLESAAVPEANQFALIFLVFVAAFFKRKHFRF